MHAAARFSEEVVGDRVALASAAVAVGRMARTKLGRFGLRDAFEAPLDPMTFVHSTRYEEDLVDGHAK